MIIGWIFDSKEGRKGEREMVMKQLYCISKNGNTKSLYVTLRYGI